MLLKICQDFDFFRALLAMKYVSQFICVIVFDSCSLHMTVHYGKRRSMVLS